MVVFCSNGISSLIDFLFTLKAVNEFSSSGRIPAIGEGSEL